MTFHIKNSKEKESGMPEESDVQRGKTRILQRLAPEPQKLRTAVKQKGDGGSKAGEASDRRGNTKCGNRVPRALLWRVYRTTHILRVFVQRLDFTEKYLKLVTGR